MISITFDDAWFLQERHRLLRSSLSPEACARQQMRLPRVLQLSQQTDVKRSRQTRELVLGRLSQQQAAALRSEVALFQGCLESAGLVPAYDIVQELLLVEWLWHTSPWKKFYRDHLAHVLKVTSVALWLLRQNHEGSESIGEWVARRLAHQDAGRPELRAMARRVGVKETALSDPGFWRQTVTEATRIACLLHDLGYAAQIQHRTAASVRRSSPFHPLPLSLHAEQHWVWQELHEHLMALPFTDHWLQSRPLSPEERTLAERALQDTHSLTSGLRILEMAREADKHWRLHPQEAFVLEWAALAATIHDLTGVWKDHRASGPGGGCVEELRPRFNDDPVSYFVALADNLQDFGRVNLKWQGGASQGTLTACTIYDAVRLDIDGPQATAQMVLSPNAAGPDATTEARDAAWDEARSYKKKDAEHIFGPDGWLDHGDLFGSFAITTTP